MTAATKQKQKMVRQVVCDHDCMLDQLKSLDNCLENIFYYGEVCSDLRGFGNLRQRCQELRQTLLKHIPDGERAFAEVPEGRPVCRVLPELIEDHRAVIRALEQSLAGLEALVDGAVVPEDLFALQERVRELSGKLQKHIHTVNEQVLPEIEAT